MHSAKLVGIIILLTNVSVSVSLYSSLDVHVVPCYEPFKANNGNLCYPCSRGFYFVSDCTKDREQAKCAKCLDNQYQPNCTLAQKCAPCTHVCPPKQVMVKDCHFTSNAVCQCEEGRYFEPEMGKPDEGVCKLHTLCDIGSGLLAKGTPFHDTKCIPCESGKTYSNNKSLEKCQPCKSCDNYKLRCSPSSNAICRNTSIGSEDKGIGTGVLTPVIVCLVAASAGIVLFVILCRRWKLRHLKTYTSSAGHNEANTATAQPAFSIPHDFSKKTVGDHGDQNDQISIGYATIHTNLSADSQSLDSRHKSNETSANCLHVDDQACSVSLHTSHSFDAEPVMPREPTEQLAYPTNTDQVSKTTVTCTSTLSELQSEHDQVFEPAGTPTLTETQSEHAWQIVTEILMCMKWTDFLRVFRRLAADTNTEYHKNIDAETDNELHAQRSIVKETIYQLIGRYRQTTPSATWQDVNTALIKCFFRSESNKLLDSLKSKNIIKADIAETGKETLSTNKGPTVTYTNSSQNIAMRELKEHYV